MASHEPGAPCGEHARVSRRLQGELDLTPEGRLAPGLAPAQLRGSRRRCRVSAAAVCALLAAAVGAGARGSAAAGVQGPRSPPSRSCSSPARRQPSGRPSPRARGPPEAPPRQGGRRHGATAAGRLRSRRPGGSGRSVRRPCSSQLRPASARLAGRGGADAGRPRHLQRGLLLVAGLRMWQRGVARMSTAGNVGSLAGEGGDCPPPVLYPQRWVQLFFLAVLALLSDLVCFSVAATPGTWTKVFNEDPATLIDLFLFTNVFSCILEPYLIRRFGLRLPIIGAAILMATGCTLRSGLPFVGDHLPTYATVVAGTLLVAMAQPFFQCTPPLLSATWFAPNERSLATAVAINFNQVGIATAFIVGGALGGSEGGLKDYFGLITVAAILVAVGSMIFFQDRPPTPPSFSAMEKAESPEGETEQPSFFEQAVNFFRTPGFIPPLAAFVVSITVTNVVGAFMEQKLERAGISDQGTIDLSGAGFELAIVIGGIILGGIVDKNKEYKSVTLACLAATLVGVLLLGAGQLPTAAVIAALLAVGAFAGPVQPINAELAVEVTYPADENAIEAVQQLCGNLASAVLVPICEWAAGWNVSFPSGLSPAGGVATAGSSPGMGGDTVVLLVIVIAVGIYFSTFSAPLRRTEVDNENCLTTTKDIT